MPQLIPFNFINSFVSFYYIVGLVIVITLILILSYILMTKPWDSPVSDTSETESYFPKPKGDLTEGNRPSDPLPGVKCPACLARGEEVWVLPGKHCPKCGHPC